MALQKPVPRLGTLGGCYPILIRDLPSLDLPARHRGRLDRFGVTSPQQRESPLAEQENVVGHVWHSSSGSHFKSFHVISDISFQGGCGEMMK
jgi:hypothetical protein